MIKPSPKPPRCFTIPPGKPFVDALAAGLLEETAADPSLLADYRILLPTRRAVRALREAFLRLNGGRPMLLPAMTPIGDIDEEALFFETSAFPEAEASLPPAIPELRRRLLLSELILHKGLARKDGLAPPSPDQAALLAAELGRLLDRVETERLSFEGLLKLAPEDYASHWQETLGFLGILTEHWPAILMAEGCIGPADRRNRLLELQLKAWTKTPPKGPVVAAGSTGSIPATADLLNRVGRLANGRLVLPGLDRFMDEESWARLDPTHPQFGLKQLLERLEIARAAVRDWPTPGIAETPPLRAELASELMRPAATTDAWHRGRREWNAALREVSYVECRDPMEEAGVIALLLRRALEEEETRAALVTPDRNLARRVAAELRRWAIEVDDSGGTPLGATAPGAFLRLIAHLAGEAMAPVPLLACFKHPLAVGGLPPGAFRRQTRALEAAVLRGPRPGSGFEGLKRALEASGHPEKAKLRAWLAALETAAKPFVQAVAGRKARLKDLLDAHVRFAESLAATPEEPSGSRLWAGEAGEALADFIADLRQAARSFPPLAGASYAGLFESLLAGHAVRPKLGQHPRIHIWGPLEARLQHADLVILGGLNEGTWPPEAAADPWMSRPMQAKFGLPLPERRIGLAAHDFAQAFSAPRVVLTRAGRVENVPTVPSRWLLRLESLIGSLEAIAAKESLRWCAFLQQPIETFAACAPCPRPLLAARPRKLSVTEIETWMRDPYAIYARRILKLEPLDPLDADPGAAERGRFIHEALDRFVRAHPGRLPKDAVAKLLAIGRQVFGAALAYPGVAAFWWPRFERIAQWFVAKENDRRAGLLESATEVRGRLVFEAPGGAFLLTAKADRIDRLREGGLVILDYKTGALPKSKDVEAGLSPQLPLEAVLAAAGGFEGLAKEAVAELLYLRLSGGTPPGEEKTVQKNPEKLMLEAREGLARLIAAFDDPATPYLSEPRPTVLPAYRAYDHLARVQEWTNPREGGDS